MAGKSKTMKKRVEPDTDLCFVGNSVSISEAMSRWPFRYRSSKARITVNDSDNNKKIEAKRHYFQAMVDGVVFNLGDDVYVTSPPGIPKYIAKIVELFEAIDGEPYFRARWLYYREDTVIQGLSKYVQPNRVYLSNIEDDNPLTCICSSVKIAKVPLKINPEDRIIPECDFYYDTNYDLAYHTFSSANDDVEASSTITSESESNSVKAQKNEKYLLDLYSGCGAMSTGLCAGASLSGLKLITKWAVDILMPDPKRKH